jgi:Ca2+-binding EF-hand superfamily protein
MDRDGGNGRVDGAEFTELIHRLQRLREGEERLLLYLMPADADGDDQLDAEELDHLLRSLGQRPLSAAELEWCLVPTDQPSPGGGSSIGCCSPDAPPEENGSTAPPPAWPWLTTKP